MRLWSIHPQYLDRQGLTAAWREALLAQAVLAGRTKGYTKHPQLERFTGVDHPRGAIARYLDELQQEATRRGYRYNRELIDPVDRSEAPIEVTTGQLEYELGHLRAKVERRSPDWLSHLPEQAPKAHPMFTPVPGDIASWERP